MTEIKETNCVHKSFSCKEEFVENFPSTVFVLRCKECGKAISAFLTDDSVNLGKLNDKIDEMHKDIKKLLKKG